MFLQVLASLSLGIVGGVIANLISGYIAKWLDTKKRKH